MGQEIRIVIFVFLALSVSACASRTSRDSEAAKAKLGSSANKVMVFEVPNATYEDSFQWLKDGNERYVSGKRQLSIAPDNRRGGGVILNRPHAIVLACSDSRSSPEILFDQKLGDIFVIRTAGETTDASVIASIEFAVRQYGINLIYVLGHNHCDVVKGALNTPATQLSGSTFIDLLNQDIRSHLDFRTESSVTAGEEGEEESENAIFIANSLGKISPLLRDRIATGKLKIIAGLYKIETGRVNNF